MNCLHNRLKRSSLIGKLVLDTHRNLGVDGAFNDAFELKFAQAVTENAIGESLYRGGQFAEALWPFHERIQE